MDQQKSKVLRQKIIPIIKENIKFEENDILSCAVKTGFIRHMHNCRGCGKVPKK